MEIWDEVGMIDREVAIYNRLIENLDEIYLFTYGTDDARYEEMVEPGVHIVPKERVANDFLYSLLLPIIHYRIISQIDIVKTNQMKSAIPAVIASIVFGVSLVVRTGFVASKFAKRKREETSIFEPRYYLELKSYIQRYLLEKLAYTFADGVMTSSAHGFLYVETHHWVRGEHVVIPNYVDTDLFRPMDFDADPGSICFVGRLSDQKNVLELVSSLEPQDVSLTIVGSGYLEDEIQRVAEEHDIEVTFRGNVRNDDLPEILNRHELFVLPSLYEGMPKALLEAMSCGLPVVGTDVMGINEVIDHESDGLLCDPVAPSISEAITRLTEDPALRNHLGEHARKKIVDHYSLNEIAERERMLYEWVA